jgi:hypothetical protein
MTSKFLKPVHDIINSLYDVAFHDGLSPEPLTRTSRNLKGIPFLAKTPRTPRLEYFFIPLREDHFRPEIGAEHESS